jgi:hypothetical protein
MKKETIFLFLIFSSIISYSQNVGIGTTTPDSSAALEIKSSSQGFLPPRMTTTQRNAITNPAEGLQIFNTTTKCLQIYAYGFWQNIYCAQPTSQNNITGVTDIDGNTYDTVRICNQTWMQKNLSVSHYRNGDIIPQVTDYSQWLNLTTGAWCWYNNDSATYGSTYGKLYNWYAVNDPRGLAPEGWCIPTDSDWKKLIKCVDIQSDTNCFNCAPSLIAGNFLREIGTNHWLAPNTGATDLFNFKGLGAGYCNRDPYHSHFLDFKQTAFWWSKTQSDNNNAIAFDIGTTYSYCALFAHGKTCGYSVRCVKDTIPSSLTNGLVAHYPFNNNFDDSGPNTYNGTSGGTVNFVADRLGNSNAAIQLGNGYVSCNSNVFQFQRNESFTVSFWFTKESGSNDGGRIISTECGFCCGSYWGNFRIGSSINGLYSVQYGAYIDDTVPLNTWTHLVFTHNNGARKVYINGVLKYSNVNPSVSNETLNYCAPFTIGTKPADANNPVARWVGKIDELRVYNREITSDEVYYLYTH